MGDKLKGGSTVGGYTIWHRGNTGAGTGMDADTVDGLEAAQLLRSDVDTVLNGKLTVNDSISGGIEIIDSHSANSAPDLRVHGKRSDSNGFACFSGKLILESMRTNEKILTNKALGSIIFGGNHTDGSEANIAYPASIQARSSGSYVDVNTMPTDLVFYTGSVGDTDTIGSSNTFGTEQFRITHDGELFQGITNKIFHQGYMGTAAGLDAGTLDGIAKSSFARLGVVNTFATSNTFSQDVLINGSLLFEGGDHRITNNDGGGNFNFRVGNEYSSSDKHTVDGSGAIHMEFAHENTNPTLTFHIGADPTGKLAGDPVVWAKTLVMNSTGLFTWGGANVYTTANDTLLAKTNVVNTFDKSIQEKKIDLSTGFNIDLSLGAVFTKTITATSTFTKSNPATNGNVSSFIIELTNGGSQVVTWFSGVKWEGGTAPDLTVAGKDILGFYTHDGGTTWVGIVIASGVS